MTKSILWFRQDLRLFDQPALAAALAAGPVLAVYILDEETPGLRPMGGAARWWLHHSLESLRAALQAKGGDLILRRGRSATVLKALVAETGAQTIHAVHHLSRVGKWPRRKSPQSPIWFSITATSLHRQRAC
jgi:deoxyribodipyrimidine photo-lyase